MSNFNPRRFAQPDTLKAIEPERLSLFLSPYQEYLGGKGLRLSSGMGINCERLASILMEVKEDAPRDMLESIYLIHEMANQDGMDRLLDAALEKGLAIEFAHDSSPADVAVQIFLKDRDLIEEQHAKVFITRARSFLYFQGCPNWKGTFFLPSGTTLQALEKDMDGWFEGKNRGRGCRVFLFDYGEKVNIVVRHGMPFRREGNIHNGESTSVYFRPEAHDLLVYDRSMNELCINAGTKAEREMYLSQIGKHLFSDESHFQGEEKYTLEPLITDRASSLVCSDIEGLEWIKLLDLGFQLDGEDGEKEIKQAKNLFAVFEKRGYVLPNHARLFLAKFQVKFTGSKTTRMLTIRPANHAMFTRDDDSLILEKWMKRRGFIRTIVNDCDENYANFESILDDTGKYAGTISNSCGVAKTPWNRS